MAFSSSTVSWFGLYTACSLPFPLLEPAHLSILHGAHQRHFMIEFGAPEIEHEVMYRQIGREV